MMKSQKIEERNANVWYYVHTSAFVSEIAARILWQASPVRGCSRSKPSDASGN